MQAKKRNKAGWLAINFFLMAVLGLFVYLNVRVNLQKQTLELKEQAWQKNWNN